MTFQVRKKSWVLPLLLSALPLFVFALSPTESNPVYPFICVSYKTHTAKNEIVYGKGLKDFCFVSYYVAVLGFVREFVMKEILTPLVKRAHLREHREQRVKEQSFFIIYYAVMAPAGLWIMHSMPLWYFQTRPMYEEYPHLTHTLAFKVYYLIQAAFWSLQSLVIILRLEKPRKDFRELAFHHIVTIALIFCSYRFHFTWIGIEIYLTMDISDIALSVSQILNYLGSPLIKPFFFVFMFIWIYMRHYMNIRILYSVATEFATVGSFTLDWKNEQFKCLLAQIITFALLFALQILNLYWLFLIVRIAYLFATAKEARDDRSDEEEPEMVEPALAGSDESKKTI